MKLIPKHKRGNKTNQFRRCSDVNTLDCTRKDLMVN